MSSKVTSGVSSSTRSASASSGSVSIAMRFDGSTTTRSDWLIAACASALALRISCGLPLASATMSRPSPSVSLTVRIEPTVSVPRCSTSTMFSLSITVLPALSRAAFTFAATGTTTRRVPAITSALACCTPSSSVRVESTLTIVAKVSGGWASCASCDFALPSSLLARVSAWASAWFFSMRRSLSSASSSAVPPFPSTVAPAMHAPPLFESGGSDDVEHTPGARPAQPCAASGRPVTRRRPDSAC